MSGKTNPNPQEKAQVLALEKLKLKSLKACEDSLKQKLSVVDSPEPQQQVPLAKNIAYHATYWFLLIFGLVQQGAGSYLFSASLFGLIPGISMPWLIVCSVIFTLLDAILFFAWEVSFLKTAIKETLGLPLNSPEINSLLDTYKAQLTAVTAINSLLSSSQALTLDVDDLDNYLKQAQLMNQDLKEKQAKFGNYHESALRKVFKWSVLAFGALSSIAGSYFMASSMLVAISAGLVGTPVGWVIIALTIIAGLGFYAAMSAKGMMQLANPEQQKFNQLKQDLQHFKPKTEADLAAIMTLRKSLIKKPIASISTQTDWVEPIVYPSVLKTEAVANTAAVCDNLVLQPAA